MSDTKDNDVSKSPQGMNTWGYVIFALMIGTTLGNVLISKRFKNTNTTTSNFSKDFENFARAKYDATNSARKAGFDSSKGPTSHSHRQSASKSENQSAEAGNDLLPEGVSNVPSYISTHFKNLELPVALHIDHSAMKTAYRKSVMKYHPDRVYANQSAKKSDEAAMRKQYETKFKEITSSYKFLAKNFVRK